MMINLMSLCGVENALSSFFISDHLTFPDLLLLFRSPISHLFPTRFLLTPPARPSPTPQPRISLPSSHTAWRQRHSAITPEFFCGMHHSLSSGHEEDLSPTESSVVEEVPLSSLFPSVNVKWGNSRVSISFVLGAFWGMVAPRVQAQPSWNLFGSLFCLLFIAHCLVSISTEFSHIPKYIYLFTALLEAQLSRFFFFSSLRT